MKKIQLDFSKLDSRDPKEKYGFTRDLLKKGAENPGDLNGYSEHFTRMLKSDNNIFRWTAIDIIGFLSAVDSENKTDKQIKDLTGFLHCGNLITCNHAIFAIGLIAKNKPAYRAKIIQELLSISNDTFETEECKSIAIGKVLETLGNFTEEIENDNNVTEFIIYAKNRTRNATVKKADSLIKKIRNRKSEIRNS
jgi:hypothetical protein